MLSGEKSIVVQDANDLLLGFALVYNRLPCPALNSGGAEDCALDIGFMPWKALGLSGPLRNAHGLDFRYGVYRNSNVTDKLDSDLAVLKNRFEPYLPPAVKDAVTHSPPSAPNIWSLINMQKPGLPGTPTVLTSPNSAAVAGHSNGLDFCQALRNATQAPIGAEKVNAGINTAFVVADPGALDANRDGNVFDGANYPFAPTFASPDVAISDVYDDIVLAVGFAELAGTAGCPAAVANVNAAARAAWAAYDEYRVAVFYAYLRDFIDIVRQSNVQINEFNFVYSATSLGITAGQLLTDAALAVGSYSGIGASVVIGIALGIYNTVTSAQQLTAAQDAKALEGKRLDAAWTQVTNAAMREEAVRLFAQAQLQAAINSDNRGWFQ